MKLYNTLARKLQEFEPVKAGEVGVYSCGPTVYWNQHIGHMYAYVQWDALVRAFGYFGFKTKWVMNITDVGHMTSDEDTGDDKMEKGAKREGLTVWQIADKYLAQFLKSLDALNIKSPDVLCRATEHVSEQIELIKKIEANGFTYKTKTGLVFDTQKFSGYADFARLNLDEQNAGSRVEVDPEKKKPWDFLLWVTNQPSHVMQWDSPWGRGFPGWHIECTAMSTKYLGEQFDVHTGGIEHVSVHHTNEIAQGFGAFGRQTANYWLHNEWLTLKGEKISKSLGNMVLVSDLADKGINPLALRYLFFSSHYRTGLDFTWKALEGAQKALERLYRITADLKNKNKKAESKPGEEKWQKKFTKALENDLNMPQAVAVVWEMVKSDIGDKEKYKLLLDWDQVLGLKLDERQKTDEIKVPPEVLKLAEERETLRKKGQWEEADKARQKIEDKGWRVEDTDKGSKLCKKD